MNAMNLREIEIYRPYNNEVPEDLLWDEQFTEPQVNLWLSSHLLRIAKRGEEILGMYAMDKGDGITYELHGVVVAPRVRKQGLGRWMVGHAIGVAESKGARHVRFAGKHSPRFFQHIGFVSDGDGQRLELIPE